MAYKGFHQLFDEGHSERMTRSETKPHLLDRLQTTSTIRAAISTPKPACIITAPDTTTRQPVGSFQRTRIDSKRVRIFILTLKTAPWILLIPGDSARMTTRAGFIQLNGLRIAIG